jgi:hypothetical protein
MIAKLQNEEALAQSGTLAPLGRRGVEIEFYIILTVYPWLLFFFS